MLFRSGKTEFIFFYNDNAIDLSKKVHVEKSHGSINEILDNLLEGSGADYKIVDRQVIFYKKKQDPEVLLPQAVVEKKQITGLVLDEHKLPVIGANVVEKVRQMGLLPIWMENLLWQYRTMLFCWSLISVILRRKSR